MDLDKSAVRVTVARGAKHAWGRKYLRFIADNSAHLAVPNVKPTHEGPVYTERTIADKALLYGYYCPE